MTEFKVVFKLRISGAHQTYHRRRTLTLPFAPTVGQQFRVGDTGWTCEAREVMWNHDAQEFLVYDCDVDASRRTADGLRAVECYDREGWEPGR